MVASTPAGITSGMRATLLDIVLSSRSGHEAQDFAADAQAAPPIVDKGTVPTATAHEAYKHLGDNPQQVFVPGGREFRPPTDRLVDGGRYMLNPGSVGQPRDGDWRAAFALYDDQARTVTYYRVPYDVRLSGGTLTFAELASPAGLAAVAGYAAYVGPEKSLVIPRDATGRLMRPTRLVEHCHALGLKVIPWTFRAENVFLPAEARSGGDDGEWGDLAGEIGRFLEAGIDGFFTDQPDIGVRARDAFASRVGA